MKGPGINDYLRILQQKKQEAHDRGEKWIEISSKELHQEVSPEHATMPTCCQAIYKLLYPVSYTHLCDQFCCSQTLFLKKE